MPTVETSVWIDAPLEKVYAIAKQSELYPEYMKDVQSVTPVEKDGNRVVSDWVGVVPQFLLKVRWRQEETWDDAATSSTFRQVQGDYDEMRGAWSFREENGGTRFDQTMSYEYNVPTLGPLVKKVILGITRKNLENIGEAIKARAESAG
jgi:uncharacterized membrane protein